MGSSARIPSAQTHKMCTRVQGKDNIPVWVLKTSLQGCHQVWNQVFELIIKTNKQKQNGRNVVKWTFNQFGLFLFVLWLCPKCRRPVFSLQLMHLRHDWLGSTAVNTVCRLKTIKISTVQVGTVHSGVTASLLTEETEPFAARHLTSVAAGAWASLSGVVVTRREENKAKPWNVTLRERGEWGHGSGANTVIRGST